MASKNQGNVAKGNQKGADQKASNTKVGAGSTTVGAAPRVSYKSMGGDPNPRSRKLDDQSAQIDREGLPSQTKS